MYLTLDKHDEHVAQRIMQGNSNILLKVTIKMMISILKTSDLVSYLRCHGGDRDGMLEHAIAA